MPNTPVNTQMLASTLTRHIDECTSLRKETTAIMHDVTTRLDKLSDKFAVVEGLAMWVRRGVGAILLAVVTAGASVFVQNYMQHQQTQAVAAQASQAAAASTTAAAATLTEVHVLSDKMDKIEPKKKP